MKKIKLISETTLNNKWKKALIKLQGECFFCGNRKINQLQAHHIVHRNNSKILKWNVKNGLLVCGCTHLINKGLYKGQTCHQYAETPEGKEKIYKSIDIKFLTEYSLMDFKTFLLENNMTEKEFFWFQNLALDAIIKRETAINNHLKKLNDIVKDYYDL